MEQKQIINVKAEDGQLIILTGEAPEPLPTREPDPLQYRGCIGVVSEFISKKKATIDVLESYVNANIDEGVIALITNENDYYKRVISSELKISPDLEIFSINTGRTYSTFDLANLIRMNRFFFTDKAQAMSLVTELKNFKAKINNEIEKSDNDRGNAKILRDQVVDHNIPQAFHLTMPLFKGFGDVTFQVELAVDANSLEISLESPQLKELQKSVRTELLTFEIEKIRELLPDLAILHS